MVAVSIIIPIYNAEKYLEECLNSILNQTLEDIEIICINDGSTDASLNILERYSKKDNRIKIISQNNRGQGIARNLGMEYVNGEYFCFMDADDILELTTLEDCYHVMKEKTLDFLIYNIINFDDNTKKYYKTTYYEMTDVLNIIEDKVFDFTDLNNLIFSIPVSPVNKLYNYKFIKDQNIQFPENLIFEDNPFFWKAFFSAKRVYILDKYYYKRRRHADSTTAKGNEKWVDSIKVFNMVWDIFKEYKQFDKFKKILYNKKIDYALFRLDNIQEEYKELFFINFKNDLINTQNKYDDFYALLNDDFKKILVNSLNSKNYVEFSLKMELNELNIKFYELKKDFEKNKEYSAHLLKDNEKLKEENKKLKEEIRKFSLKLEKLEEKIIKINEMSNKKDKNSFIKKYTKFLK